MADGSKVHKITRDKLYTDLMYRFSYLCKFVDFKEEDQKAVKAAAPLVGPLVPTIVDKVYQKLFSFDITRNIFMGKMDGVETSVSDDNKLLQSEAIGFRKDMLSKYLVRLVTSEFDEILVRFLDKIAAFHTKSKTKRSNINVEYIHINALMGYVETVLIEAVLDLDLDKATLKATLAAFNKLLWIQNDLFAQYYVYCGLDMPDSLINKREVAIPNIDSIKAARGNKV